MIRELYPHFQPVIFELRSLLTEYIRKFPPYSDFSVWNLMGWSNQYRTFFSFLNGNLIIRSWDCYDNRNVYSLLGTSSIDDTLRELFRNTNCVELVPQVVIQNITDYQHLIVEEDPDNHDYILSLDKLINMSGNSLYSIRAEITRFPRYFPHHEVRKLDFQKEDDRLSVKKLVQSWCKRKGLSEHGSQSEVDGIESFMKIAPGFQEVSMGLYIGGLMVGFTMNEIVSDHIAIMHFGMGDLFFEGSSRYITHATAKVLRQQGCKYLNYEQDMGIPGLRRAKLAYRPVNVLKKYKIRLVN